MKTPRRPKLMAGLFALLGGGFLIVTFVRSLGDTDATLVPDARSIGLALVLSAVGLWFAGKGWTCLFSGANRPDALAAAFYTSQLGKYVPGGIWQPVGLVGLTRSEGVAVAQTGTVLPVHIATQIAGAGVVSALVFFAAPDAPSAIRFGALAGFASPMILYRGWMDVASRLTSRWLGRDLRVHLPSQRAILVSFGWAILTVLASGAGFAVMLRSLSSADSLARAALTFGLGWVVGFLAVPFPSGLGVREGVLLLALSAVPSVIVAAAVAHRLVTMVAEVLAIGTSRVRRARREEVGPP